MWRKRSLRGAAAVVLISALFAACGGEKDQTDQSRPAETAASPKSTELKRIDLDNGVVVYLQEEHTDDRVALEVFYRAGFVHEPRGQVQLSHLTEHVAVHAASKSFAKEEALNWLRKSGRVAAQAHGDCVQFDYIVYAKDLDQILQIEAEHLESARIDSSLLASETERALSELDYALTEDPHHVVTRFAVMSLVQVIRYGRTNVPIYKEPFTLTPEQVMTFHDTYYRPDDMVIVMVGGFDTAEAERLVRKHFEGLPRRPAPPRPAISLPRDVAATWDIDAQGFFYVFPGPYAEIKDRVTLAMFGAYIRKFASELPEMRDMAASIFTSSPVSPVRDMPYFIYAQPSPSYTSEELQAAVVELINRAKMGLDDKMFAAIKRNARGFVESSRISKITGNVDREKVLGQEAINIGLKHNFREGMSPEEFSALLDGITLEDMNHVVARFLSDENRRLVTFSAK